MKKAFSLILIAIISFTLVSCGQKEFDFNEDSEINFMGNAFTVYSGTMFSGPWLPEKRVRGGSASHDRFLDRIEQIEKDYNVKIRNEHDNIQTKILAMTLNGGGGCDMIHCGNDVLYNFYTLGILTPFEEIGVKDNKDEKFGIPSLLVEGTFDGTQFGITNYLGDSTPSMEGLITINMELLRDLAMTDPHEYAEKGEWNWENFRTVLAQGTFDDGEIKHVGMISDGLQPGMLTFFGAIIANGGYLIKEIDGVYKSGLSESNAIEAMDFMSGLVEQGLIEIAGGQEEIWYEGKTWPMNISGGLTVSKDIASSVIRFPYGPSGSKDIVAAYSVNRNYYAFSMLSSFDNDEIGIIIDDLFEPLDASLYPEGWKNYAIDNVFYNDYDYETFMTGLETMNYYPLGVLYGKNMWTQSGEVESALDDILFGRGSAQAKMDSVKSTLKELIDEKLNLTK